MTQIREKIVIKEKESKVCNLTDLVATLKWRSSVDLDLWCLYITKDGKTGEIGFSNRGNISGFPYIELDKDAGIGDSGGDNEENIRFKTLEHIEHAFILANIFNKSNANFASYDGLVSVKSGDQDLEVPLTSKTGGSWCVIAHFDNTSPISPMLENINVTLQSRPVVTQLVNKDFQTGGFTPRPRQGGLLRRLFGG